MTQVQDIQVALFIAVVYGVWVGLIVSVIRWFIFSAFREQ